MNESDRERWDRRYHDKQPASVSERMPLAAFAPWQDRFPDRGLCLEIAVARAAPRSGWRAGA
jgi:hypothetical protein